MASLHAQAKPKSKRKVLLYASAVAGLAMLMVVAKATQFIARSHSISDCPTDLITASHSPQQQLAPRRVVVQPWEGRHNVYAVFVIPQQHFSQRFVAIRLDDQQTYCGSVVPVDERWVDGKVEPGQQVVIGLLRTRTALWLVTNGKKKQLEQPQNWTLSIQPDGSQ